MTAAFSSERQKTAQRLARELLAFGGKVTNVLPLREGQNLRFWVSDYKKNELLQQMKDAGYEPVFVGMMLQACEETYTLGLVNRFELVLPADRQPTQSQLRGDCHQEGTATRSRSYTGICLGEEMKSPRKPKASNEPSLIEQLSKPLRDFVDDFKTHGASVLQKVREDNPEKYLELSTKLLPLVVGLNPGADDFSDCKDKRSIGIKLLKSVG